MATLSAPFSSSSYSSKPQADASCGMTARVTPKFVPVSDKGVLSGGVPYSITAQAQENVFLKYFFLTATKQGFVRDIRVGNQSLNCSDSAMDLAMFSDFSQRYAMIGIAVDGNIQTSIDFQLDGTGTTERASGGFSCDAIDKAPTLTAQCDALNKFFGMGDATIAPSGSAQLSAQALRDCHLCDLLLQNHTGTVENNNLVVTDITVAGRSLFSGQNGDGIGLNVLVGYTQKQLIQIDTDIQTNQRVIITIKNTDAVNSALVGGGFFVR